MCVREFQTRGSGETSRIFIARIMRQKRARNK
jgi:hypothetical protein